MKKIFFLILASYLIMNADIFGQTGQSGLAWLKSGAGGRALGMGEAYSAIASDPSATYYNPSALSLADKSQILLMHKEWIQGMKTEFIGASAPWNNFTFGLSVNAASVDDIPIRVTSGPPLGSFDSKNAAIGLTTAYDIGPSVAVGITGKFLYEKIFVDEASGFGIDIGGLYKTDIGVNVALTVSNLGSMSALSQESSELPTAVRGGASYSHPIPGVGGNVIFAGDAVTFTREKETHVHLGTEFVYRNSLALRFGYQTGYEAKSISAGLGLRYGILMFDYAFVPFLYDFGSAHTFSLVIEFD